MHIIPLILSLTLDVGEGITFCVSRGLPMPGLPLPVPWLPLMGLSPPTGQTLQCRRTAGALWGGRTADTCIKDHPKEKGGRKREACRWSNTT